MGREFAHARQSPLSVALTLGSGGSPLSAGLRDEDAGMARIGDRLACWQRIAPVDFVLVATVDSERYFTPLAKGPERAHFVP